MSKPSHSASQSVYSPADLYPILHRNGEVTIATVHLYNSTDKFKCLNSDERFDRAYQTRVLFTRLPYNQDLVSNLVNAFFYPTDMGEYYSMEELYQMDSLDSLWDNPDSLQR